MAEDEPDCYREFRQADYSNLVRALDLAMDVWIAMGRSEEEAQKCLKDFILEHYFVTWRNIKHVHHHRNKHK